MLTKPHGRLLAAIVAAAIVSQIGCINSANPLIAPEKAETDKGLYGIWRGELPGIDAPAAKNDSFFYVGPAGKGYPEGMMRVVIVEANDETQPPAHEYLFFETRIAGVIYLNFPFLHDGSRPIEKWKSKDAMSYKISRCTLRDDILMFEMADTKALKEAVESKKLQGTLDGHGEVQQVTSSTEELAKFLATPDGKKLFDREVVVLKRAK